MTRTVYLTKESFLEQNRAIGEPLPYQNDISCLAQPLELCGHTVQNRLVCQAMEGCEGQATGEPGELTRKRYLRLAEGGAGIIWFEATACRRDARANPRQLWLREGNIDAFSSLLDEMREAAVKKNGYAPLIILQSTHSGRYSKPNGKPEPQIACHNPIFEADSALSDCKLLSDEELDGICEDLIKASVLARKAGFDGVDIKACHRYLLSELLSAFTRENSRYGGSYENRTRLLREAVAGSIAAADRGFIVTTRLNAYDGICYPFGWGVRQCAGVLEADFTEPVRLAQELMQLGVPLLNVTMGNPYFNPHVNRPFAKGGYELREHPLAGVARVLNGVREMQKAVPELPMISSAMSYLGVAAPEVAAAYISDGGFAFAGFGRMILANPEFANQILTDGVPDKSKCCIACSKCTELMRAGGTPGCVIRNAEIYLPLYRKYVERTPDKNNI